MKHLQGLDVLVLGLGESGLAMARWCARHGAARVRVWDSRAAPPGAEALAVDVLQAELLFGTTLAPELLREGVQLVLKSPGLAPGDERVAPLLQAAAASGVLVQGELALFARALADLQADHGYAPRLLAVTGTNGKTTTTALTALLVERAGLRVAVAGNIGPTMLDTLAAALDAEALGQGGEAAVAEPPTAEAAAVDSDEIADRIADEPVAEAVTEAADAEAPEVAGDDDDAAPVQLVPPPPAAPVFEHLPEAWVLELSSFQLDGVQGFEPDAAAVLNVSQDHLDWHGTMDAYAAAKSRIFGSRALMVVNRDDPAVAAMVPPPEMVKGGKGRPAKALHRRVVRFGLDAPRAPGDFGLVVENGMAWLVRAQDAELGIKRRPGDEPDELHLQRLMPADALRIRGRHNAANALAALALAGAIGCPLAKTLHALREYRGEPHRVEFLATVDGVEAFDDSKGTNVGATVAALSGLGADKAPAKLAVILGGDGKGQDFSPLADGVRRHARAVALIGRDAAAIEDALRDCGVPMARLETLQAATRWCFAQAEPGDAVLLSPACASLDMFRNYAHRAEVFAAEVQALAAEHGEALA